MEYPLKALRCSRALAMALVVSLLVCSVLSSCDKYDDSEIKSQISNLDSRVTELERLCNRMNTNIESLQGLVSVLLQKDYVTSVTPVKEGDNVIGYTINFTKSPSITIYNGKNGETPQIGVKEVDGVFYWTINGDFLKDSDGKLVCASAQSGVIPQMKVQNDKWYLSLDNGKSREEVGVAIGDFLFKEIKDSETNVHIVLANGTTLDIPKFIVMKLVLDESDKVGILPCGKATIKYELSGANVKPTIKAICQNGWKAEVSQTSNKEGKIVVTAPEVITDDEIIILVSDNEGRMVMATVNFAQGIISPAKNSYQAGIDGGSVEVPVNTNLNYNIQIPSSDQSWLKVSKTSTRAMRTDNITFSVSKNSGVSRSSEVKFLSEDGKVLTSVVIMQTGNEPTLTISSDKVSCDYNGASTSVNVTSNTNWTVSSSEIWCTVSPASGSKNGVISITISENKTNDKRDCTITVKTTSGNITRTISVSQTKPPYYHLISNAQELKDFCNYVNNGGEDQNGRLTADISLSGTWSGIGTGSAPYSGIFDGNGHSVKGISSSSNVSGLFGCVKNANIHHLTVDGTLSSGSYMGGIAGKAFNSTIDNCSSNVTISSGSHIGGIVGYAENCTISNCSHLSNDIGNSSSSHAGGIAGESKGTEIYNCYNKGKMCGYDCYAGIVGYQDANSSVKNSYNNGSFKNMYFIHNAGGIVGYNCGRIENCYSSGTMNPNTINGDGGMVMCGGVVGYNHTTAYCYYCYFLQQSPINKQISWVGDFNWATYSKCGPFNGSGNFSTQSLSYSGNTSYLRTSLNQWVNANQSNKYKSWRTDQAWPDFSN